MSNSLNIASKSRPSWKPRILHVIGSTASGGAERVAVDLARQFMASGYQLAVFALSGRTDGVGELMRRNLEDAGVAFSSGPAGAVRLGAVLALARALASFRPDVVHVHTPNTELAYAIASALPAKTATGVRTARTIHSVSVPESSLYLWAFRRNKVALSVACSASVAGNADWARPLITIRNGVDFSWPIQSPTEKVAARRRLGIEPLKRHYLMVGNMQGSSPHEAPKSHDVLISAWQQVDPGMRNMELHLIGDGNLRPDLERLAAGDPTIRFWGVSPRVADWLLAADIFVMPSRIEGLPMAGIEALGTGLPCIFSDIAPLRELAPVHARWFSPDDVTALARHLEAEFQFDKTPGDIETARIRSEFSIERMVREYMNYYDKLLSV